MQLDLHIDELILEGVPSHQRQRITSAIEVALAELVAERGLPPEWRQRTDIFTITRQMKAGNRPDAIGHQFAQAILGGASAAPQPVQAGGTNPDGTSPQNRGVL